MSLKYLFLDVDGVLNYDNCKARAPSGCRGISDKKVKLLKQIIDATGAKIILSSDWRLDDGNDYQYLVKKLERESLHIYDKTIDINWSKRGLEIEGWIDTHDVDGYVILDDTNFPDFSRGKLRDHLVITDYQCGLSKSDVVIAIRILNNEIH